MLRGITPARDRRGPVPTTTVLSQSPHTSRRRGQDTPLQATAPEGQP